MGALLSFVGFWRPQCPYPHDSKIYYYLNDRDEGRYYFCMIPAPPMPPPPSTDATILNHLGSERGTPLSVVGFWRPPITPLPDATILNYPNDRE